MLTLSRVALFALLASRLPASLHFSSPSPGQVVSGQVTLAAVVPASTARVDYRIGSHLLGSVAAAPFSLSWNSAEAMDGASGIEAYAFSVDGAQLDSAQIVIQISNRHVSLAVNSPDLTQPLSGTVPVEVTGADADAWPAIWTLNIDGEEQSIVWTDNTWKSPFTVTLQLNTTRFSNGLHELHISMNSRTGPENPQWVNWRGMVNRVIDIENGDVPMDIQPGYQNVYLAPGQSLTLGCQQLSTSGHTGFCGAPVYQSGDSTVASVDESGTITAVKAGFTQITLQQGSLSSVAQVWVVTDPHLPHFSGSGEMLNRYNAVTSLFVVAPFFLDPTQLEPNPSLLSEVAVSGVNTLGFGVYLNPRNVNATYDSWQTSFDAAVLPKMTWARDHGYHLLLTGDDIFREIGTDAWYTLNWPSAQKAVHYAAGQLAATGVGIAIEGIDEASSLWGPRPVPQGKIGSASYLFNSVDCRDGNCIANWPSSPPPVGAKFAFQGSVSSSFNTAPGSLLTVKSQSSTGFQFTVGGALTSSSTPANDPNLEYLWFAGPYCAGGVACNPVVPNNALAVMRNWLTGTVPVAFPPIATAGPTVFRDWVGTSGISDYASQYFTSLKTRTTYPWSEGIQEMVASVQQEFYSRQPYMQQDRPQLMLVSLAGPSYTKQQPQSATYVPGTDVLSEPGVSPEHVTGLMMTAAALGGAGLRLYYFEPPSNYQARAALPVGSNLQTGANPENLQADSWRAMGYAANLLTQTLQPYLLDTRANSPAYGRNIITAARTGAKGNMLLIVNGNDWERTVTVDLTPYQTGQSPVRYHLGVNALMQQVLPPSTGSDKITLAPGESVAFVFPAGQAVPVASTSRDKHYHTQDF